MEDYLRIYFQSRTEAVGPNIAIISIALLSESGSRFYAEINDNGIDQLGDMVFNEADECIKCTKIPSELGEIYSIDMKDNFYCIREKLKLWIKNEHDVSSKTIQICTDDISESFILLKALDLSGTYNLDLRNTNTSIKDLFNVRDENSSNISYKLSSLGSLLVDECITKFPFGRLIKSSTSRVYNDSITYEFPTENPLWRAYLTRAYFMKLEESLA